MTIAEKITYLREQWKKNPDKRSTIELQVKVLQTGLKAPAYYYKSGDFKKRGDSTLVEDVQENLL